MRSNSESGLSTLDYHVLLAMAEEALHGYAVRDAVEEESAGTLSPRAGTLYRVIARLMAAGWVAETTVPGDGPHPGRPRRYYELTSQGRIVLAEEAHRLQGAAALAQQRLGVEGR